MEYRELLMDCRNEFPAKAQRRKGAKSGGLFAVVLQPSLLSLLPRSVFLCAFAPLRDLFLGARCNTVPRFRATAWIYASLAVSRGISASPSTTSMHSNGRLSG